MPVPIAAPPQIVTDSLARSFFGTRFQLATDGEQRYFADGLTRRPAVFHRRDSRAYDA